MKLFGSLSELVSIVFRKNSQAVTLRPNQSTTYTASRDIQIPPGDADHVIVSATSTQTLTNKTLTAPVIATISNTGTLTLPTSTDTLVGRATTDTLINKTLTSPTINGGTVSGASLTVADNVFTLQDNGDATKQAQFQLSGITTGTTRTFTFPDASGTILTSAAATFADSQFILQDNGDNTKQLQFQVSGVTTGTTRTLTAPDANTTIVGTDATQTLTNKDIAATSNTYRAASASQDGAVTTGTQSFAGAKTFTSGTTIDGSADEVQFLVEANATQTANISVIRNSSGGNLWSFDSAAEIFHTRGSSDAVAPTYSFRKARTSPQSPSVVSSGDIVGFNAYKAHDGTQYLDCAYFRATVDGTPGTNDMPTRFEWHVAADGASSPTERMRLRSTGVLDIGNQLAVSAYKTGGGQNNQTSGTTPIKITFDTEEFDTQSAFATSTFTPGVTGKYHISCAVAAAASSGNMTECGLYLYKNGSVFKKLCQHKGISTAGGVVDMCGSVTVSSNTTDTFEIYAHAVSSAGGNVINFDAGQSICWFTAVKVA